MGFDEFDEMFFAVIHHILLFEISKSFRKKKEGGFKVE
jgi:hypothetical protein